jgi:hypothetical protein
MMTRGRRRRNAIEIQREDDRSFATVCSGGERGAPHRGGRFLPLRPFDDVDPTRTSTIGDAPFARHVWWSSNLDRARTKPADDHLVRGAEQAATCAHSVGHHIYRLRVYRTIDVGGLLTSRTEAHEAKRKRGDTKTNHDQWTAEHQEHHLQQNKTRKQQPRMYIHYV